MIEIGSFLDILLILYTCFLILALVKRIGIYSLLNLQRIRNLLFLLEGFFILGALVIVKLEYLGFAFILFAAILGSAVAIGDFYIKLKKNLKNNVCIPQWINKLYEIWHKKFRLITLVGIIVVGILGAFVYSTFYEEKYSMQEYRNIILTFLSLSVLIGTTLYLLLIILSENKYGPIYYKMDKNGGS